MKETNPSVTVTADRVLTAETPDATSIELTDFICQVLNTVLLDGAVNVTDLAGRIASQENNYLMNDTGSTFTGLVTVATGEVTEFTLFEKSNGAWGCKLPCALVA
jgi:hypothetical protein